MEPKQIIVVRRDLKMPPGKMAAQVAHASMGALLTNSFNIVLPNDDHNGKVGRFIPMGEALRAWLDGPFVKICLGCETLEEIMALHNKVVEGKIRHSLITDSGRTVFTEPTVTCLAIGPEYGSIINEITGHLTLY